MHLVDLPEVSLSHILSFLITPITVCDALNVLTVDKHLCRAVRRLLAEEVSLRLGLSCTQHALSVSLESYYRSLSPKILLVGGLLDHRKCELLHPWSGRFRRVCSLGIKRSDEFSLVSYRGHAVVLTGADDSSLGCVEALNLRENRWCLLSPLPLLLAACAAVVRHRRREGESASSSSLSVSASEEELFVIGGVHRTTGQRSTQIFRLTHSRAHSERGLSLLADDDETMQSLCGVWESCEGLSLSRGRSHHGAVFFRGRCWVAGGLLTGEFTATRSVEALDFAQHTLTAMPPMLTPRMNTQLVVIETIYNDNSNNNNNNNSDSNSDKNSDNINSGGEREPRLFAVGGDMNGIAHASSSSIEVFDEREHCWRRETLFPARTPQRARCAVAAQGERIYVFGGAHGSQALSSWDFYDVRRRFWGSEVQEQLRSDDSIVKDIAARHALSPRDVQLLLSVDFTKLLGRPNGAKGTRAVSISV